MFPSTSRTYSSKRDTSRVYKAILEQDRAMYPIEGLPPVLPSTVLEWQASVENTIDPHITSASITGSTTRLLSRPSSSGWPFSSASAEAAEASTMRYEDLGKVFWW